MAKKKLKLYLSALMLSLPLTFSACENFNNKEYQNEKIEKSLADEDISISTDIDATTYNLTEILIDCHNQALRKEDYEQINKYIELNLAASLTIYNPTDDFDLGQINLNNILKLSLNSTIIFDVNELTKSRVSTLEIWVNSPDELENVITLLENPAFKAFKIQLYMFNEEVVDELVRCLAPTTIYAKTLDLTLGHYNETLCPILNNIWASEINIKIAQINNLEPVNIIIKAHPKTDNITIIFDKYIDELQTPELARFEVDTDNPNLLVTILGTTKTNILQKRLP